MLGCLSRAESFALIKNGLRTLLNLMLEFDEPSFPSIIGEILDSFRFKGG